MAAMNEKVAVVTGANKGIGLAIVRSLCRKFKGIVYLTARDETKGAHALQLLNKEGLYPKFHPLDIDSEQSIKKLQDFLKVTHGGIDVLVNNAGIAFKSSADDPFAFQAEVTTRVNFNGTLKLCEALLPLLRKHGRVVMMSSYAGHLSRINGNEPGAIELRSKLSSESLTKKELANLVESFVKLAKTGNHTQNGWPDTAYGVSKVAVSALARIYQREFNSYRPGDDLIINSVHPGLVDTDMTSHTGPLTPDEGAQAPTYAALLPSEETDSGLIPRGEFIWLDRTVVDWVKGPLPIKYF